MVHRTYIGLGPRDAAVREFDALAPDATELLAMRAECEPSGPDWAAMAMACDALETAAYHFTGRPNFYHRQEEEVRRQPAGNGRLSDRVEAVRAFESLAPYAQQLRSLMFRCRPFGRDYLALQIPLMSLETAAFHFTRRPKFYGCAGDSAGPARPD